MMENDSSETWALQKMMTGNRKSTDNARADLALSIDNGIDSQFVQSIKLLLKCCRLFGLFYTVDSSNDNCRKVWRSLLPSILLCFILSCNVLRSLTVYQVDEKSDNILFFKIQLSIWSFESAVKAFVVLIYCYRHDGFQDFFRKWNEYFDNIAPDQLTIRVMKICTVICWIFVFVNTMGILLCSFLSSELGELFLLVSWPEVLDDSIRIVLKLIMTFVIFLTSVAAVFPIALLVVLSLAVIKRFDDFGAEFKSCISPEGDFNGCLDSYRLRHQKLCTLVDILDRVFMIVIAIVFIANTVMFCMILYNLIYTSMPASYRILNIFWLTAMMLHVAIVSLVGAWMNVSAHSPLRYIYNIRAHGNILSRHLEMSMFISRLTGAGIGLTSGKMFVIDKPSILTVAGMMITYFIVMLEFKQGGDPPLTSCNCTVPLRL